MALDTVAWYMACTVAAQKCSEQGNSLILSLNTWPCSVRTKGICSALSNYSQ